MASGLISLWDGSAQEAGYAAPLPEDVRADVVIVGGGFTGLSCALHAAEAGLDALVLEARQIGFGGSGRNVGLVNAGVWLPPAQVRKALGDDYGPRFVERFGNAPQMVFDLIERHQIRCEPTRTGTIHAAHATSGFNDLRARHVEWQRLGAPVELLDAGQVAAMTGSRAFKGGLLDHRAGTINPMGYVRGLARAARGAGARIATGVSAQGLARDGAGWRIATDQGPVHARHVVLATNAYTDRLWPGLSRVFTKIPFFQVATEPLGARAAAILPGRQGLWDTGRIMISVRRDRDDRLILGSMGQAMGALSQRWAQRQLRRLFPDLGAVELAEAWHGDIAMTPDHLPRVIRLDDGVYTAIGYNGRGITTGTLFGQAIAGLLTGAAPADLPLPLADATPAPFARLSEGFYRTAFAAHQLWRAL